MGRKTSAPAGQYGADRQCAAGGEWEGPVIKRDVIPWYSHIDCIYGQSAAQDVYPYMLDHLEATL